MESAHCDESYGGEDLVWSADPNRFLVPEVENFRRGRALDLRTGAGCNAIWPGERVWQVAGVDFSAVGLANARRLAGSREVQVEWIEADLREYQPPAGSFDLVVILYLHMPTEERRLVLRRAAVALAPGGTILIIGHDLTTLTEGIGGPQNPAVLFTPESIAIDLEGLHIERAKRVLRTVMLDGRVVVAIDALVRAVKKGNAG